MNGHVAMSEFVLITRKSIFAHNSVVNQKEEHADIRN